MKRTLLIASLLTIALFISTPLLAAVDCIWTGAGADTLWTNPDNWANSTPPSDAADTATFPSGTPATCLIDQSTTIKTIYFNNPNMTLTVAAGANLYFSNLGALVLQTNEDTIINGDGTLTFSVNTGTDWADTLALTGKTLTILARVTGPNGYEHQGGGGTIILANTANDYQGITRLTGSATTSILEIPTLANTSIPCSIGVSEYVNFDSAQTLRYTGASTSTDRDFRQNAGIGVDATIHHAGTGTLTFNGSFYSSNDNGHAFKFFVNTSNTIINNAPVYNGGTDALWFYKQGPGTQVLTAANTYTGPTIIQDGTLAIASSGSLSTSSQIRMQGGTLALNSPTPATTYTATFGSLQVNGTATRLIVEPGATTTSITFSDLTFSSGSIDFTADNLGTTTQIFITNQPDGIIGPWATINNGTTMAAYSSTTGIYPADLSDQELDALGPSEIQDDFESIARITGIGTTGNITLAADPTTIATLSQEINTPALIDLDNQTLKAHLIRIQPAAASLTIGTASGNGTLTSAISTLMLANADTSPATALTIFADIVNNSPATTALHKDGPGDVIISGDLLHTGGTTITAGGNLILDTPAATTRTIPSGTITGSGNLLLTGGGTVEFPNSANTLEGSAIITNGTAKIYHNATFGTSGDPIIVKDKGTIDLVGTAGNTLNLAAKAIVAEGFGPDSNGALRNTGSYDQFNAIRTLTLTDDLGIHTPKRIDVRGGGSSLKLNGHTITKQGAGIFGLTDATVTDDQSTSSFDIQQGALKFEVGTTLSGTSANHINIASGTEMRLYSLANPVNWTLNLADGSSLYTRNGYATNMNIWAGPVNLTSGTATLNASGIQIDTLAGKVSGSGALKKDATTHSLTYLTNPANDYSGGTTITAGAIVATEPGTIPNLTTDTQVSNTGALALRVADAAATQPGFSTSQINAILTSSIFKDTSASIGFETLYEDLDYTSPLPHLGIRKLGPNTLTLSGSGDDLHNIIVYGGTLDLSPASRYLDTANISVGHSTAASHPLATLIIGNNSQITTLDRGYNVANQPIAYIGDSGRGTLHIKDNAKLSARIIVGNNENAIGAIYQTGGIVHNTGGTANDGRIGSSGYGYYYLADGIHTNNGYSQVGQTPTGVGILKQTGGAFYFHNTYAGNYGISRGGTGVVHLEGGTFNSSVALLIGDHSEADAKNGYAALDIAGSAQVILPSSSIDIASRSDMTAMINFKGGTLAVNNIYRKSTTGSQALFNWDGGTFKPNKITEPRLFHEESADHKLDVFIYPAGAKVDLATADNTKLINIPLQAPTALSIASIPLATSGAGYIGSPFVKIEGGGGKGAAAFAHVDHESGTVTSIEVTSPGTGYTRAPTVTLVGGGATTAATLGTPLMTPAKAGGLLKQGPGTLAISAETSLADTIEVQDGTLSISHPHAIPPTAPILLSGGTLSLGGNTITNQNVTITEGKLLNGTIAASTITKQGSATAELGSRLTFSNALPEEELIPGLWEGRLAGSFNKADPNTQQAIELTTTAANGNADSGGSINGKRWPDNTTYVYNGYIWNRNTTNETWTFAKNFDDGVYLLLDGVCLIDNGSHNTPMKATVTVTPGPHPIEIRFGQGGGGVGANKAGWWSSDTFSFGVDYLGRDAEITDNYQLLSDPGDGSRLTLNAPGFRGPGLQELLVRAAWDTTNDGALVSRQLTTRAGNGAITSNATYAGNLWAGDNHTWIYRGIIWNRTDADLTWTWRFTFDDDVSLTIDNQLVRYVGLSEGIQYQNHTLTPGPHTIEIRFGDGAGNVGPASGLGGLTYDPQARGSTDPNDYILLEDPGDGSLLTTDIESDSYELADHAQLLINEGTLRLTEASLPGLWEGRLDGNNYNITDLNPATSLELTTTAANGYCSEGGSINGKHWPNDSTYVYSGYIWNRDATNVTWTFAENFDDNVLLKIDDQIVIEDKNWGDVGKGNHTLTPGPHKFEIRFGQGGGGAGTPSSHDWWSNRDMSFGIDFQGRNAEIISNYEIPVDPGDGSLFTTEPFDANDSTALLGNTEVVVAPGATLDLNGTATTIYNLTGTGNIVNGTLADGTIISPAGDNQIGTMSLDTLSLAGTVTYRLTISDAESDKLTSNGSLDLTGMVIIPATNAEITASTYIIAEADQGFTGGKPTLTNFPDGYKIIRKGTQLHLTKQGGTIMLLR